MITMEKQKTKNLSFLVFRHDLETVAARADLAHRILLSAEEHKPNLIITPKGSFSTIEKLNEFYEQLKKTSRNTILVTGGYDSRLISKALVMPQEKESKLAQGIKSEALVIPANPRKKDYDLLIVLGKDKEDFGFLSYIKSLKTGGHLIKNNNTRSDCVIRLYKEGFEIKEPLARDNQGVYEMYVIKFN
jgi:hypothetical protein